MLKIKHGWLFYCGAVFLLIDISYSKSLSIAVEKHVVDSTVVEEFWEIIRDEYKSLKFYGTSSFDSTQNWQINSSWIANIKDIYVTELYLYELETGKKSRELQYFYITQQTQGVLATSSDEVSSNSKSTDVFGYIRYIDIKKYLKKQLINREPPLASGPDLDKIFLDNRYLSRITRINNSRQPKKRLNSLLQYIYETGKLWDLRPKDGRIVPDKNYY